MEQRFEVGTEFQLKITEHNMTVRRFSNKFRGLTLALGFSVALAGVGYQPAVQAQGLQTVGEETTLDQSNNRLLGLIAKSTYGLMTQLNFAQKEFDAKLAEEGLEMYLKTLDPMKLYFTADDAKEFKGRTDELIQGWKRGDLALGFDMFNRYLERVDERVALANDLIDSDFDFTKQEELVIDRELIEFVNSETEIEDRWRRRIKYSLMLLEIEAEEAAEERAKKEAAGEEVDAVVDDVSPKDKLHRRYRSLQRRMHQFNEDDVAEMFITSLTSCYDPHTSYMAPTTFEDFMISMRLNLDGIGATLQSTDDGLTQIKRIVPGGAADKCNEIEVDDKIVSVGQDTSGEMVDITDMRLKDVVSMIRGEAGTTVRLGIMAKSGGLKTVTIVREKIELMDSAARGKVFEQGTKADGSPYKVGVIDLPSFYTDMEGARNNMDDFRSTTRDVERLLNDFKKDNVDAVVLDLRMNGGGSLREAIDCTGLFIDRGPVVQVKDPIGQIEQLDDNDSGVAWDGPLVVLTSKFSASASEILAGAIQDYQRGLVVGDPATHGKGTVQNLLNLAQQFLRGGRGDSTMLGALKITIQQFYRPSGDSTQKRGVEADIVLPSISANMDVAEGDLDYALEFDQIKAANFTKEGLVQAQWLDQLREASQSRLDASDKFKELKSDIQRYIEQKEKKSVTLNKAAYLAEREEFNAEKQDEDTMNQAINGAQDEIERNYYLDEVLQIAVDYSKLVRS